VNQLGGTDCLLTLDFHDIHDIHDIHGIHVFILDLIAERRIAEAIERGELSNLPGEGKPLELDDDALVPEELRLACRILRNAGFVPPEVETLREIGELERLLEVETGDESRAAALRKLQVLRLRLELTGGRERLSRSGGYFEKLLDRLA
jgi:hypothetical protein